LGLTAAAAALARRAADPAFLELYTDESLWAFSRERGPAPSPDVPVFVGWAQDDLVVPPAAVAAFVRRLEAQGARPVLASWPGDHLDALARPSLVSGALAGFDRAVRAGR
ncbi:MAG: hypothetical protein KGM24_03230, partial [Elusimicrobia bacterium]|nr:hypothetical protein [Elusimicrobiota bacterium]